MHCKNCKIAKPQGKILEQKSNKSDWNDYLAYDMYINGTGKCTEFDYEFYCFHCFPNLFKDVFVEDMRGYNEGINRY